MWTSTIKIKNPKLHFTSCRIWPWTNLNGQYVVGPPDVIFRWYRLLVLLFLFFCFEIKVLTSFRICTQFVCDLWTRDQPKWDTWGVRVRLQRGHMTSTRAEKVSDDTVNLAHWATVCSNRVMGNLSSRENKGSLIHGMPRFLRHISLFFSFSFFPPFTPLLGKRGVSHVSWAPSSLNQTPSLI